MGKFGGINFITPTRLKVCDARRIHGYKAFMEVAERGYTPIGRL